nr:protein BCCIP homolog [Leptinotarsa decemlineata]
MAGSSKRPKPAVDPKSESESSGEEGDSEEYQGQEEVMVDFEGRNIEADDYQAITEFLRQLFLNALVEISNMADLIIAQYGVGTALKQAFSDEDDDDDMSGERPVFGISTLLNLNLQKKAPCVQKFRTLLEELCDQYADSQNQAIIKEIMTDDNVGLLINERFVNIPPLVSVPMLNSLKGHIDKMKKKHPSYNFAYYIMICKTYRSKDSDVEIFCNAEEEYFCEEACASFQFKVQDALMGNCDVITEDQEAVRYRKVIIFEASKLNIILEKVTAVVQP